MNVISHTKSDPSSPIKEDNMMINQQHSTKQPMHKDTQWFVIQKWERMGDIILQCIDTNDHSADGLKKTHGKISIPIWPT